MQGKSCAGLRAWFTRDVTYLVQKYGFVPLARKASLNDTAWL